MMRSIVCAALFVCSVEKTRWPVSAAVSTVCIVSTSRISPTMITSGSWRMALRSASRKLGVSVPTSRCEIAAVLVDEEELDRVLDRDDVQRLVVGDLEDHRRQRRRLARARRAGDEHQPVGDLRQVARSRAAAPALRRCRGSGSECGGRPRRPCRAACRYCRGTAPRPERRSRSRPTASESNFSRCGLLRIGSSIFSRSAGLSGSVRRPEAACRAAG